MSKKQKTVFYVIVILSIMLRLSLVLVNRDTNDNHIEVVNKIITTGQLPQTGECWECFQPKLFYWTAAQFLKLFTVNDQGQQILLVQIMNLMVSILMLWFIWKIILQFIFTNSQMKLIAFGLIALNPGLIGINVQSTNDTFVIAFSIIALYFADQFINQKTFRAFIFCVIFSSLSVLSKTNGVVTVLSIGATYVLEFFAQRNFKVGWRYNQLLIAGFYGLCVLVLVVLAPTSQFISNFNKFGTPTTLNISSSDNPLPSFFVKTETIKPGILSIQDGFFTFRFPELLIEPQITTSNKNYPIHRTSFWTILYGRANFVQYSQWPPAWVTSSSPIRNLGRAIYLLALFPTLTILLGTIIEIRAFWGWLRKGKDSIFQPVSAGLFGITWIFFLAFDMAYAMLYRRFDVIKAIFIFPALPAIAVMFLVGWTTLDRWYLKKKPRLQTFLMINLILLLGCYSLDMIALFFQLFHPG